MMIACRWRIHAACQGGPHLKKMTELLSDTYSTASVQWASSCYRRLLWSSSNFPKLHWPLVSAKLDWLEWFSLGRFVVQRLYTKSRSTRGWVGANMSRGAGWVGWPICRSSAVDVLHPGSGVGEDTLLGCQSKWNPTGQRCIKYYIY